MRLDDKCEDVEQCCTRKIRNAIRKHLPRLGMLHLEVEKAVFPLPRSMLRLEIIRRDRLDREKLKVMEEQIKTRKRKREELELGKRETETEKAMEVLELALESYVAASQAKMESTKASAESYKKMTVLKVEIGFEFIWIV